MQDAVINLGVIYSGKVYPKLPVNVALQAYVQYQYSKLFVRKLHVIFRLLVVRYWGRHFLPSLCVAWLETNSTRSTF